jgi:hypothetical protein
MSVTIRADTLIYNTDSFKDGTERKLENIFENLPGVEINENGQIEVGGKVVNKFMVNDKDFFDRGQSTSHKKYSFECSR